MEKITGHELLKDLDATERKLSNLKNKIDKKFDLILNQYQQYIPDDTKNLLSVVSLQDVDTRFKAEVIIATEAEYVKQTSNQVDLFN